MSVGRNPKPTGERTVTVTVRLPEWVKDALDELGGASRVLRQLGERRAKRHKGVQ